MPTEWGTCRLDRASSSPVSYWAEKMSFLAAEMESSTTEIMVLKWAS